MAVAFGDLDGQPVALSGDTEPVLRVWHLAGGAQRGEPLSGHDTATRERGVVLRNLSKVGPDSAVCAGSADRPSDRAIAFTRKQRSPWPGAWPHAVPPPASLAWGDLRATLNSSWATY
jgi:hypothetical protein